MFQPQITVKVIADTCNEVVALTVTFVMKRPKVGLTRMVANQNIKLKGH